MKKNKSGLTSVTFRQLGYREIIELTKMGGLDGIEWGGDIHVPEGNIDMSASVGTDTASFGLEVLSYGSYFKVGENNDVSKAFLPVLVSAETMKSPVIRVWAGTKGSADISEEYFKNVVNDTQTICDMAEKKDITICFEYHRGTLTDNCRSTLNLIRQVNRENLKTYWQPNPDMSHQENMNELKCVLLHLEHIHVFHWTGDNIRHSLNSGADKWREYIEIIKTDSRPHSYILEFVKNDDPAQFMDDTHTLLEIIK